MKKYYDDQTLLDIRVVITRPSNDPLFDATIKSISEFETTMSIVFDCHIYTLRQVYAESLLEQLIDEGLSGEELKITFNRMMQSKPKLKEEKFEEIKLRPPNNFIKLGGNFYYLRHLELRKLVHNCKLIVHQQLL